MSCKHSYESRNSKGELLYSLIVPLFNEQDNILPLVEEIEWVMHNFKDKWELILVNDGSNDRTQEVIQKLIPQKPYLRTIQFSKNYGQSSAFDAGFKKARGQFIITLDGDGQNDPRDIPLLIETSMQDGGYDLIAGIRKRRQDSLYKRSISKMANAVRKTILGDNISDSGCSLKMYRQESLQQIPFFEGMHRFLPALFQINGFRTIEVPVHHRPRLRGKSKYTFFGRGISLFFDMLAVFWMRKRTLRYTIERELP